MSFWIIKFFWSTYIKSQVNYSPNLILIAFPAFTILFLTASYFAGLYDSNYRQSRLNRTTLTAILVLLAAYSLLPETLRFSRGILLFGSFTAFLLMSMIRWLLQKMNVIESENDEINQTLIAGTEKDFNEVSTILQNAGLQERVLGRIEPGKENKNNTIGSFNDLKIILKKYPAKEIIFCEGTLSFKKIIEVLPELPHRIRRKFFASGMHFLIGGNGKNKAGTHVSNNPELKLNQPVGKRNKIFSDIIISLFFLLTFPVHLLIKRKPFLFFKNVITVLMQKKTWIAFASPKNNLPDGKKGILTTTGLPSSLNTLPDESLQITDVVYASNFHLLNDMKIIWFNYKFLS